MRGHLRTAIVAVIGVVLVVLFLRNANLRDVWTEVTRARLDLVVLAIALTYGGMLGKVYGDILESGDNAAARALLANGGGRLQAFFYGLLPQGAAELASYTVYRWECAIRSSVVLGFVGAGGLGQMLDTSTRMFAGGEVATMRQVIHRAAEIGGHPPPRIEVPDWMMRGVGAVGTAAAFLRGPDYTELVRASLGVTYWFSDARARSELGYASRPLKEGLRTLLPRAERMIGPSGNLKRLERAIAANGRSPTSTPMSGGS